MPSLRVVRVGPDRRHVASGRSVGPSSSQAPIDPVGVTEGAHAGRTSLASGSVSTLSAPPKEASRVVEPGFHRPDRDADDVGDGRERHPGVVVQDDDRAVLRRQAHERPLKGVTVVDGHRRIGPPRPVDRQCPDMAAPMPVPARLLVTGVDEEAMEPGS